MDYGPICGLVLWTTSPPLKLETGVWWAYCSLDSSLQCHSVANSTADRVSDYRQSYHTLHELRYWRFSNIHSTVDLYSTTSDVKTITKSRPQFEHGGGYVTSHPTVANRWKQVNAPDAGSSRWRQHSRLWHAAAACSLCIHRYRHWLVQIHMKICKSTTSVNITIKIVQ